MELSKILVAREANLGFVKIVGRGSFQNSGCFQTFYREMLRDGVDRFVVDLEACSYMDSTFLGTLLGLALQMKQAGHGLIHALNASSRNLELLKNLGLDRLIKIAGRNAPANGNGSHVNGAVKSIAENALHEIACPVPTREEAAPTILKAHENLMEFDSRNVAKFKDVVEFLRDDLRHSAS